jgi:manganese oxidase
MGVNYRSSPMTFRGSDPSSWFSSSAQSQPNMAGVKGDPDTPIIQTYPGERLRIRLIQGSHEEQHGFAAHGLRWRRDWGHPQATLVNQQTLGISEAFTLDINPADASTYSVGDHLYHFCAIDDIWLGCWGGGCVHCRRSHPISKSSHRCLT